MCGLEYVLVSHIDSSDHLLRSRVVLCILDMIHTNFVEINEGASQAISKYLKTMI